jgi:Uma2 family endonuclease
MSIASVPSRSSTTATEFPLYRLSVSQYEAMLDAGVLWHGCHVELLEGLLIEKRDRLRDDDPVVDGERLPIYRLRVDDYLAMHEHGIITDDTPVELLEGLLVEPMVRRPPHDTALGLLQDALVAALPSGWILRVQSGLQLTDSVPEPDIAIVHGDRRDFATHHPTNENCGLVIEVADSSLAVDRGPKLAVYARHSITEYWIVNLTDEQIEVCSDATGLVADPEYRSLRIFRAGESIPLTLDGVEIATIPVSQLLP